MDQQLCRERSRSKVRAALIQIFKGPSVYAESKARLAHSMEIRPHQECLLKQAIALLMRQAEIDSSQSKLSVKQSVRRGELRFVWFQLCTS